MFRIVTRVQFFATFPEHMPEMVSSSSKNQNRELNESGFYHVSYQSSVKCEAFAVVTLFLTRFA
jgi:hypothetical protein